MFSQAMENDLDLLSIYVSYYSSYIPAWISGQGPQESELMANVRNSKEDFKNQFKIPIPFIELLISKAASMVKVVISTMMIDPNSNNEYSNPLFLLALHYYFIRLSFKDCITHNLNNNTQMLTAFQDAQVDGYSCIGAVLIAKKASDKEKYDFIQELINDHGFEPTAKDIVLANLALYDEIPAQEKKKFVLLLCNHQEDNLSDLLPEIRKQIAQRMIQLCKKEFWLLPETY